MKNSLCKRWRNTEKTIVEFEDTYALTQVAENHGLEEVLKKNLENFDTIMTLICYQMTKGTAMYNCLEWIGAILPASYFPKAKLQFQNISK